MMEMIKSLKIKEAFLAVGLFGAFCGSCCSVFVICVSNMAIVHVIVGLVYKNDCNLEPNVPWYLILNGILTMVCSFLNNLSKELQLNGIMSSCLYLILYAFTVYAGHAWILPTFNIVQAVDYVECSDTVIENCIDGHCNYIVLYLAYFNYWIVLIVMIVIVSCAIIKTSVNIYNTQVNRRAMQERYGNLYGINRSSNNSNQNNTYSNYRDNL